MYALVVFESMFGNTQRIAKAVAQGLASRMDVRVTEVGEAPGVIGGDVAMLVVGGPTHAFGMSRKGTRESAAQQAADKSLVSPGAGIREWLATVRATHPKVTVAAAFDTRVARPRMPGSAARAAHRRLGKLHFRVMAPRSFYVMGGQGPLVDGEVERARHWGEQLASRFVELGSPFTVERPEEQRRHGEDAGSQ